MKNNIIKLAVILTSLLMFSCANVYRGDDDFQNSSEDYSSDIQTTRTVYIPDDDSGPVAGFTPAESPDTVVTFSELGKRIFVKNGTTVNFIYDGIDPDDTYVKYESWEGGYYIQLMNKNQRVDVHFSKICQLFIVQNPSLTIVDVPRKLRYEQIIWTPREDGTWEVRIGTTERGCKSKSLQDLQKLRTKKYKNNVPK